VTRRDTFNHLSRWLQEARQFASPNIVVTLVGNKADIAQKRQVKVEEAKAFAAENQLYYIEASAKSGDGVDDAFLGTAQRIWDKLNTNNGGLVRRTTTLGGAADTKVKVTEANTNTKEKKKCC
jgi:GTPase SAR1 family protein